MNYELAKQLKDAGFPQSSRWAYVIHPLETKQREILMTVCEENNGYTNLLKEGYMVVANTTLSELIEACDSGFKFQLIHAQAGWLASTRGYSISECKTPEEAVAKLWFELNKSNGNQQNQENKTI